RSQGGAKNPSWPVPESRPASGRMRPAFGLGREEEKREACNGMQVMKEKLPFFREARVVPASQVDSLYEKGLL
ncbi:MAG: hypothetical protein WBJ77_06965, partial [Bacillota bacterium]